VREGPANRACAAVFVLRVFVTLAGHYFLNAISFVLQLHYVFELISARAEIIPSDASIVARNDLARTVRTA
jgi:hypothetical protein